MPEQPHRLHVDLLVQGDSESWMLGEVIHIWIQGIFHHDLELRKGTLT